MKKEISMAELKKKYFSEINDMAEISRILTNDIDRIIEVSNKRMIP